MATVFMPGAVRARAQDKGGNGIRRGDNCEGGSGEGANGKAEVCEDGNGDVANDKADVTRGVDDYMLGDLPQMRRGGEKRWVG